MMKRIGELLVEAGVVSQAQVDQGLRIQAQHGKRLGQTLVELGMATDADVARALAMQPRFLLPLRLDGRPRNGVRQRHNE